MSTDHPKRLAGAAGAAFAVAAQVPDPDDAAEQERLRTRLVDALGMERFQAAYDQGTALSIDEALGKD